MSRHPRVFASLLALCLVGIASAAPAAEPAKSPALSAEQAELGFLVGKWTMSGSLESHPLFASTAVTGKMTCEWFAGQFAVLCRVEQQSKSAGAPTKALRIFGYSPEAKAYTSYGLTDTGHVSIDVDLGSFAGGAWTFTADERVLNGQKVKFREQLTKVSPTSFKLSQELAADGGAWRPVASASFTKVR